MMCGDVLYSLSVICGSCTAGGAYIPSMSDESIIVMGNGTIFLGGPPLVKAATGEEISAEALGGASVHSEISGVVDHMAETEVEALHMTRNVIANLGKDVNESIVGVETPWNEPLYDPNELGGIVPTNEKESFDIADVIDTVCEKLIHRHPHIYGDVTVANEEEVKQNWEKLKLKEGKNSVLEGVPISLPAMVKANRIQEKARGVGFDWDNQEQVWEKVNEELSELQTEIEAKADQTKVEQEFGDVLFSMINYARFIGVDPEAALERTNKKFINRFQFLEQGAKKAGRELSEMTLAEMDEYWNAAKATNP